MVVASIAICILFVILGLIVLLRDTKAPLNLLFFSITIITGLWIFTNIIANDPHMSYGLELLTNRLLLVVGGATILSVFLFISMLRYGRWVKWLKYVILMHVVAWILCLSPFVVSRVSIQGGLVVNVFGSLTSIYLLVLLITLVFIIRELIMGSLRLFGLHRKQFRIVTTSIFVASLIIIVCNAILPMIGYYGLINVSPMAGAIVVFAMFYVITKHRLFDIRLAIMRTFSYLLTLLVLAATYFGFAYLVVDVIFHTQLSASTFTNIVNVSLALLLAFIFQPIKRFFDRVTNVIFYHNIYNADEFIARMTRKLSRITDLEELLTYSSAEVSSTLKATFGAFFIYRNGKKPLYVSTDKHNHSLPQQDTESLNAYMKTYSAEILITGELTEGGRAQASIHRLLTSHQIAVALLLHQDNIILGYLFLGNHLSTQYTHRDIRALQTIANELTIAIQNALSVQEVRDVNEHLQQRIDNATKELRRSNDQLIKLDEAKDEFVSMASHQLRTPLTSVKGYISMLLEGDAGQINETQKHFLGEAFTSSERMVHLINDFLNVSRLQTGKFVIERRRVNLKTITEQEVESLRTTAKQRQLTLKLKTQARIPQLYLDENKIRQVIMNFIDNALYYSTTGTAIAIELKVEGGNVVLTVKDTGIGVPESEQAHLFSKFYRASNARKQRPDGTGVGLFLAQKVIVAHGGSMIFASEEGKGSTFGFSLPIAKLERAPAENADNLDN